MNTRSFDQHDRNVVTAPNGARVHRWHLEQSAVIEPQFQEVRGGVWCLVGNGLSNQTFIDAPEGIIAIDTGESIEEMRLALRRLREVTDRPIAAVLYSHFHYVEGTKAVFEEGNHVDPLPIYGHERIAGNKARAMGEIGPAYSRGLVEQFAIVLPDDGPDGNVNVGLGFRFRNADHAPFTMGHVPVTHPLRGGEKIEIAGLGVEFHYAPSDCDDSLNMWFPALGTCVHNSIWPVLFNVFAIRGEEYRDPRILIPGIDNIISWSPEYLVATHGPAVVGRERIREVAVRDRDSIQFMWDQTVRAINKGWTTDEIASRVRLPDMYDVDAFTSERYGVTEHHVRQIHNGLRGWYDGDESKLFPEEPSSRHDRLIAGFGGREEVARQIGTALGNDDVRWATEMATWLVRSAGAQQSDRDLLARCLRTIAERTPAANIRSWCLTRARHLDGTMPLDRFYGHPFNPKVLQNLDPATIIATLRVIVDPEIIEGVDHHVAFHVDGVECGLHVRNHVVVPTNGWGATSLVRVSKETLLAVLGGRRGWSEAVSVGDIVVTGDPGTVDRIRLAFENKGLRT